MAKLTDFNLLNYSLLPEGLSLPVSPHFASFQGTYDSPDLEGQPTLVAEQGLVIAQPEVGVDTYDDPKYYYLGTEAQIIDIYDATTNFVEGQEIGVWRDVAGNFYDLLSPSDVQPPTYYASHPSGYFGGEEPVFFFDQEGLDVLTKNLFQNRAGITVIMMVNLVATQAANSPILTAYDALTISSGTPRFQIGFSDQFSGEQFYVSLKVADTDTPEVVPFGAFSPQERTLVAVRVDYQNQTANLYVDSPSQGISDDTHTMTLGPGSLDNTEPQAIRVGYDDLYEQALTPFSLRAMLTYTSYLNNDDFARAIQLVKARHS